ATDPVQTRLNALRSDITRLTDRTEGHSREEMLTELSALRAEAARLGPAARDKPGWPELTTLLNRAAEQFNTLASENPGPDLFQPPVPETTWQVPPEAPGLAPEVSFRGYKLRPPAAALLDLHSSEDDPQGLVWRLGNGGAEMAARL